MRPYDAGGGCEAESPSREFRREERIEHPSFYMFLHPAAVIADLQADIVSVRLQRRTESPAVKLAVDSPLAGIDPNGSCR